MLACVAPYTTVHFRYDLVASSVIASEPTIASSWSLKKNASDENRMPARIEL